MLGLKCKAPNTDVVKAGYAGQILTVPAADNVVRLLPALTITEDELAEASRRLDAAAAALNRTPPKAHGSPSSFQKYGGGAGAGPRSRPESTDP
jgi:hypothetical protein